MTNASAVSRVLRRGGLLPVPAHSRDGVYVTGGGPYVAVIASVVGQSRQERVLADEAERILTGAGYVVVRTDAENILHVRKDD